MIKKKALASIIGLSVISTSVFSAASTALAADTTTTNSAVKDYVVIGNDVYSLKYLFKANDINKEEAVNNIKNSINTATQTDTSNKTLEQLLSDSNVQNQIIYKQNDNGFYNINKSEADEETLTNVFQNSVNLYDIDLNGQVKKTDNKSAESVIVGAQDVPRLSLISELAIEPGTTLENLKKQLNEIQVKLVKNGKEEVKTVKWVDKDINAVKLNATGDYAINGDIEGTKLRPVVRIHVNNAALTDAPTVQQDVYDNLVGNPVDITYDANDKWFSNIKEVRINNTVVDSSLYKVNKGTITLDASLFPVSKIYSIRIKATGYNDSVVAQLINTNPNQVVSVDKPSDIQTTVGGNIDLPTTVKATLGNGTTKDAAVIWSGASIDTSKSGTYRLEGKVEGFTGKVFLNVIINASPTQIVKVENLSDVNVKVGDTYVLPTTVKATLGNGTTKDVAVIWNGTVDTSKSGIYKLEGKVDGFSEKVFLNVNVSSNPVQIVKVENPSDVNVKVGDTYVLPTTVKATLTDGTTKNIAVKWNGTVNTTKAATYKINGTVDGYNGLVEVNVKVSNVSIGAKAKVNVKVSAAIPEFKRVWVYKTDLTEFTAETFTVGNSTVKQPLLDPAHLPDTDTAITLKSSSSSEDIAFYDANGSVVGKGKIDLSQSSVQTIDITTTINPTQIVSVQNPSDISITVGGAYSLPQTVKATLANGTTKDVTVKWNGTVDNSKAGLYNLTGVVDGYDKTVALNVKVGSNVQVAKVNVEVSSLVPEFKKVWVYKSDLQNFVASTFTIGNNTAKQSLLEQGQTAGTTAIVKLGSDVQSTDIIFYDANGTVVAKGKLDVKQSGTQSINVNAQNPNQIVTVQNPIGITILVGGTYTLPQTVKAVMGDGATKDVAVKWSGNVDTSKAGAYNLQGTVDGYSGSVTQSVTVGNVTVSAKANVEVSSIIPEFKKIWVYKEDLTNISAATFNIGNDTVKTPLISKNDTPDKTTTIYKSIPVATTSVDITFYDASGNVVYKGILTIPESGSKSVDILSLPLTK